MLAIAIKKVALSDIETLQKISKKTFFDTFSPCNTEENTQRYLDEQFSKEQLTAELNNSNSAFYFAVLDNTIIGYLKLNTGQAQTELQDAGALEIERIYVLQAFHGKKAGQVLYEKAIQIATDQNAPHIWLGVWEENKRAIRFYEKNGFTAFGTHIFRLGNDAQTDLLMRKKLIPDPLRAGQQLTV